MVFFIFIQILKEPFVCKQWRPDQTPRFAASDLVLHCLPMSHKKDAIVFKWVKRNDDDDNDDDDDNNNNNI